MTNRYRDNIILLADLFTSPDMVHIKEMHHPEDINTALDEAYALREEMQQTIVVRLLKQDENQETSIENHTYKLKYA